MDLDFPVQSFSTLSRRAIGLSVVNDRPQSTGPITLIVDGTGLKIHRGSGWQEVKHGTGKTRKSWRKLTSSIQIRKLAIGPRLNTREMGRQTTQPHDSHRPCRLKTCRIDSRGKGRLQPNSDPCNKFGPRQFFDFAMHPRWSLNGLIKGKPQMANFDRDGYDFDRTESRARADWDTLARLRDIWPGKLVVKGVLDAQDSTTLKAAGVDAIQVSSHGCRQLESAPAAITALADIRAAVGPDYPLFYDTGLRSGEDVVKAYTQGANFTFLGRILQYAIAANGEDGLKTLWSILQTETNIALAQIGRNAMPIAD